MPTFFCETCGRSFYRKLREGRPNRFCSCSCRGLWQSRQRHPDLDEKFFQHICTKEKAYWLGFLMADGCINDQRGTLALTLTLSKKDEDQIDRFITAVGASPDAKKVTATTVTIQIYNKVFVDYLVRKGCCPRKTSTLKFPGQRTPVIAKAFLLGYYDGDGSLGSQKNWSPILSCGSVEFLEQVKSYYDIASPIRHAPNRKGECWVLVIGRPLFRELLANYEHSMLRKRIPL